MNRTNSHLLTINGGSSSIKFALFDSGESLTRMLDGRIEGIGRPKGSFTIKSSAKRDDFSRPIVAGDYEAAINILMEWVKETIGATTLSAVGHRVVHGGPQYWQAQRITPEMISALREISPFDPEHLPEEIQLIEAFSECFPDLPQVACFDTAFHHDLPRVARQLAIPRRYEAKGIRKYGFHGLSCAYLIERLNKLENGRAPSSRVVLAHLGSGASITAVRHGSSIDTSMSFTPAAGLPMSTRSGDLDPGICGYLARTEGLNAEQFSQMTTRESGLLGISETSPDMRELIAREKDDARAAEAVALFCYQAKKWIGAYAAALGGIDTLVFAGGIGEKSAVVRERICEGLDFLGIELDEKQNAQDAAVISSTDARATVRVIPTDEELMIAKAASRILGFDNRNG